MLDPIGFGFEAYDAAGRYRVLENAASVDESGAVNASPIGEFSGVAELAQELAVAPPSDALFRDAMVPLSVGRLAQRGRACCIETVVALELVAIVVLAASATLACGPAPLDVISLTRDQPQASQACSAQPGCLGALEFRGTELQTLMPFGDKGGAPTARSCPDGDVAVGLVGRVSAWSQAEGCTSDARWLTSVGLKCAHASAVGLQVSLTPSLTTPVLGGGGDCGDVLTDTVTCPPEQVLTGYMGYTRHFDNFSKTSGLTLYCSAIRVAEGGALMRDAPQAGPTLGVTGDAAAPLQLCAEGAATRLESTAGVTVDSLWLQCQSAAACSFTPACQ